MYTGVYDDLNANGLPGQTQMMQAEQVPGALQAMFAGEGPSWLQVMTVTGSDGLSRFSDAAPASGGRRIWCTDNGRLR